MCNESPKYGNTKFLQNRNSDSVQQLLSRPRGLMLVTGPTGSGKTTTLASGIDWINTNFAHHILTIEDPIEFIYKNKIVSLDREVGEDTNSFSNALRSALREDPDIILVGEMRDLETISLAITAAETGLSTWYITYILCISNY